MSLYAVTAHKTFENNYGMTLEEPVKQIDAKTAKEAELIAENLFNQGGYSSIYIDYAHPEDASCFYNPVFGHESSGTDWVSHFD